MEYSECTALPGAAGQDVEILAGIFEYAPDATLLVDVQGRIVRANAQVEQIFGYRREELLGQRVETLIPERYAAAHPGQRQAFTGCPHTRAMGAGLELWGRRKDNSELPVDIMLSPLQAPGGLLIMAVVRDVTERKRMEQEADNAREMYMRELRHRVKNNLQVIASLLFLQASITTDAQVKTILRESHSRVKSIALVHERLHQDAGQTKLDLSSYAKELVREICGTYGVDAGRCRVQVEVDAIPVNMDTAVPCGLIITELVTNALKHAFPPGEHGEVEVQIKQVAPRTFLLTVADTGAGMPVDFSLRESPSLGLNLVRDLAAQLDGTLEILSEPRTEFRVHFKEIQYKDRES